MSETVKDGGAAARAAELGERHGRFIGRWLRWFFPAYWRALLSARDGAEK